jgi:hypothetical protein
MKKDKITLDSGMSLPPNVFVLVRGIPFPNGIHVSVFLVEDDENFIIIPLEQKLRLQTVPEELVAKFEVARKKPESSTYADELSAELVEPYIEKFIISHQGDELIIAATIAGQPFLGAETTEGWKRFIQIS